LQSDSGTSRGRAGAGSRASAGRDALRSKQCGPLRGEVINMTETHASTALSAGPDQPIALGVAQVRKTRQGVVAWGDHRVTVGGGAPVRVQAMTNTDTADAIGTAIQVKELALAGSELVRITVNNDEAAKAV